MSDSPKGYLPLRQAIEKAGEAWQLKETEAWKRLRLWMNSGLIQSKALVRGKALLISPGRWSVRLNDGAHETGDIRYKRRNDFRRPAFVNQKDLLWLLDRATDGIRDFDYEDNAVLIRLYSQINDRSSAVPIAPLTNALQEPSRSRFKVAFTQATQARLFDGKGLKYLCRGQWSPLDSTNVKTAIEVAGNLATFERRYVMMAALPQEVLMAWATKFDVPLPNRLRRDWNADFTAAGPLEEAAPLPPAPPPVFAEKKTPPKSQGGRPAHPDKTRMFEYAAELIESGQYASREDRTQTKKMFVEAVFRWMQDNAFAKYKKEYIEKLLTPLWRRTR